MLLDKNTLKLTQINEDGTTEPIYFNLSIEDERLSAVSTLILQLEAHSQLIEELEDELKGYYELEMKN